MNNYELLAYATASAAFIAITLHFIVDTVIKVMVMNRVKGTIEAIVDKATVAIEAKTANQGDLQKESTI